MIQPDYLNPGDKVAIVAPAGRFDMELLKRGIALLEQWGLEVVLGQNIDKGSNYFSGSDEQRLEDLQWAFDAAAFKAVFCARGGYGTTRILDQVNFAQFLKHPKWLIGFSDITALHFKLHTLGVESIHGLMPTGMAKAEPSTVESLKKALFGEKLRYDFPADPTNREGKAQGRIIGGNLSLIADSIGTSNDIDFSGKILFIEEVDEYLYKIDRMLQQLKRAGKLENLAGLLAGHFSGVKDTAVPYGATLKEVILNQVKEYTYPVAFGLPVGHEPENLAIIHSHNIALEVEPTGTCLRHL